MSTRYVLRVKASNLRCELRINDVPAALYAPGEATGGAEVPVNEFLLPGANQLQAWVGTHPQPSRAREAWASQPGVVLGALAGFQAELLREDDGAPSAGFQPLRLAWQGVAEPQPRVLEQAFSAGVATPRWAYTQATALGPEALAAAMAALQQLRALLEQKKVDSVLALMAGKLDEVTRQAYGVPPEPLRAGLQRALQRTLADPAWQPLPLDPAALDLRLVAQGRLVECLRPDGRHAFTWVKPGSSATFFLPVMLGLLQGRWQVLR
jgi:hypothetical protein